MYGSGARCLNATSRTILTCVPAGHFYNPENCGAAELKVFL